MEEKIIELFQEVCRTQLLCGSQRCDGEKEWLDGCPYYLTFRDEILELVSAMQDLPY